MPQADPLKEALATGKGIGAQMTSMLVDIPAKAHTAISDIASNILGTVPAPPSPPAGLPGAPATAGQMGLPKPPEVFKMIEETLPKLPGAPELPGALGLGAAGEYREMKGGGTPSVSKYRGIE